MAVKPTSIKVNGPVTNNNFDNTTWKGLVYSADLPNDILMAV